MAATAAAQVRPVGSDSSHENQQIGRQPSLDRELISRPLEDLWLQEDVTRSRVPRHQSSSPTSSGDSSNADLAGLSAFGPGVSQSQPMLHALQEWEGYVVEIGPETFEARLLDVTAGARYDTESASIPLAEVSSRDRERMRVGSIFRWVIGYETSPSGTKKRVSLIVFRELPAVTDSDLRAGREWAREVMEKFGL